MEKKLLTVLGASGLVGSSILREALDRGYHVNGTLRNIKNEDRITRLKKLSSEISQADESVGNQPYLLFGPNLLEPSLLNIPEIIYRESYAYSVLKKAETSRSLNSKEPTLFKYPPAAVFAEISAYSQELFGIPYAVPFKAAPFR